MSISLYEKEFIMELFLDTDNESSLNRLVVAMANVVNENNENITLSTNVLKRELQQNIAPVSPKKRSKIIIREGNSFYENIISNYNDEEFEEKFKMKRTTVERLAYLLSKHTKPTIMKVTLLKKIHIFLWVLTSGSSYKEIGKLFGLHKSSVSYIYHEVASMIAGLREQFIKWPTRSQQHSSSIKIKSCFKFPNCVGFISTCRFKVGSKINKKDEPATVLLQAVCNERLEFIDTHLGKVNTIRKLKVYKDSPLSRLLEHDVDFEYHILGDSEYQLKMNLVTPYGKDEVLTDEEMLFNEVHCNASGYIRRAFELLKERFRKLNHIDLNKPRSIHTLVTAACVLHNFILKEESICDVKEESVSCDDAVVIESSLVKSAVDRRQFLCNYLSYMSKNVETDEK